MKNLDSKQIQHVLELSRLQKMRDEGARSSRKLSRSSDPLTELSGSRRSIENTELPEKRLKAIEPKAHRLLRRMPKDLSYLDTDMLNMKLITGYLAYSKDHAIPPLQLRRTLDQYFYTHLKDTSRRDSDQVVYRHTKLVLEPKIFMVDQLWLWILDDGNKLCQKRWHFSR